MADRLLRLMLLAAAAISTLQPVRSFDFWWHLASGRLMVAEGRLLQADPFSFTRAGTPWLNHEWLAQLVAYLGTRAAGEWFPALATLVCALLTFLLLADCVLRRAGAGHGAWLLLGLSLAGIRFRFDPRPETASYLFLALLLVLLQTSRQPGHDRRSWLLFPLFALWANVHPAVLLGAAIAVLWLVGEAIDLLLAAKPPTAPGRALIVASSLSAILINPGGARLLRLPLDLARIVASGHAPNLEWLAPRFADFPLLYLAAGGGVLLLLTALAAGARDRREAGIASPWFGAAARLDWRAILPCALAGLLAFQQLRNIGFFFLMLPLALARPVAGLVERARVPSSTLRALEASVLVLLAGIFLRTAPEWRQGRYLAGISPARAVDFLEKNDVGQRLFNDVKFGGYLAWERYPRERVFIDGRNEIYDSLLAEVFDSLGSWERWENLLERYGIDAAMLRRGQLQAVQYPPEVPGGVVRREMRAFSAAYFQPVRWALVYWDDDALIFVRRDDPRYRSLLDHEFRIVNPDDAEHLLSEIGRGKVDRREALAEVERKLEEDPACVTARQLQRALQVPASASAR